MRELNEEAKKFIQTGRVDGEILSILPKTLEAELILKWQSAGFNVAYRYQPFEYMNKKIRIEYLQAKNPRTDMAISLIPWFLVPGRPYPVFVYAYAAWHYVNSSKKSMEVSAMVAGKIFGVGSFSKSTLSRWIKSVDNTLYEVNLNRPLSIAAEMPHSFDLAIYITELLEDWRSVELLAKAIGAKICSSPSPVRQSGCGIALALSNIPHELSNATLEKGNDPKSTRDLRRRPVRRRKNRGWNSVQRIIYFIAPQRIDQIRREFIAQFMFCVMDMATIYHRFLV
jgi:hypothetical protein